MVHNKGAYRNKRDELEFLQRVFLLATITIETDSITIKRLL